MDTVSNDSELLHDIAKGVQGPIDAALAELSTFGTVARTLLAIAEQSGRRPGGPILPRSGSICRRNCGGLILLLPV